MKWEDYGIRIYIFFKALLDLSNVTFTLGGEDWMQSPHVQNQNTKWG